MTMDWRGLKKGKGKGKGMKRMGMDGREGTEGELQEEEEDGMGDDGWERKEETRGRGGVLGDMGKTNGGGERNGEENG